MSSLFGIGGGGNVGAAGGFYSYSIDQSVRGDDSSYLYRKNVATVTDGKKFTWSGWVKRTKLGSNETFFGFGADGSEVSGGDYGYFQFTSSDNLRFFEYINTGAQENNYVTTQVFRIVYACGRDRFDPLRGWFSALYEVLLGASQGPRFGGFIALYGVEDSIALIEAGLAGKLAS